MASEALLVLLALMIQYSNYLSLCSCTNVHSLLHCYPHCSANSCEVPLSSHGWILRFPRTFLLSASIALQRIAHSSALLDFIACTTISAGSISFSLSSWNRAQGSTIPHNKIRCPCQLYLDQHHHLGHHFCQHHHHSNHHQAHLSHVDPDNRSRLLSSNQLLQSRSETSQSGLATSVHLVWSS